jgi:hypothetical protein
VRPRSHLRGREPLPPRFSCPVEGVASRRKVRPVLPGRRGWGWGEMTRSGDLLGACTPKGTATYPANNAWTAAYPANHVGLAPSLPGSSLPGKSCGPRTEPTRQQPTRQIMWASHRAYPAAAYPADSLPGGSPNTHPRPRTYPANHDACVAFAPGWAHPVDLPGKSRRVRTRWTYPANHDACAPGGPTRQITGPTRQVRISEGVLGQACKTCLTVGSEHGEASGLC